MKKLPTSELIVFGALCTLWTAGCGDSASTVDAASATSALTAACTPDALFHRGIAADQTVTINRDLHVAAGASIHGNRGFTVNSHSVCLSGGTISAATAASLPAGAVATCRDYSGLSLCDGGKAKTQLPALTIPAPDVAAIRKAHLPANLVDLNRGDITIRSQRELDKLFPRGSRNRVHGNIWINAPVTLDDVVIDVEGGCHGRIAFNVGPTKLIGGTVLAARELAFNGPLTVTNGTLLTTDNLYFNTDAALAGDVTIASAKSLYFTHRSRAIGSTAETASVALIATQDIYLNGDAQLAATLWAGGSVLVNGATQLRGGIVARGSVQLNDRVRLEAVAQLESRDLPCASDFKLGLAAGTETLLLAPGGTATLPVTLACEGGLASEISFTVTGLPAGVTADSASGSCDTTVQLTLHATASAPKGPFTLIVTGSENGTSHTLSASGLLSTGFSVEPAVGTAANPILLASGETRNVAVHVTRDVGFDGPVTLAVANLPAGVTAGALQLAAGQTDGTLSVTASSTAAIGPFTAALSATSGGVTKTVPLTGAVTGARFALAVGGALTTGGSELDVRRGASLAVPVSVTWPAGTTPSAVAIAATNLPAGVTAQPLTLVPGQADGALLLTIAPTATLGLTTVQLQGTAQGVTSDAAFGLRIGCPVGSLDDAACTPVATTLSQLRWELPCLAKDSVSSPICTCSTNVTKGTALNGDPNQTYNVTLRFRGVVELRPYVGGVADGYFLAGAQQGPDVRFNIYALTTSNPPQTFYLNAAPDTTTSLRSAVAVDYTRTIAVKGGSQIGLIADSIDEFQKSNFGPDLQPVVVPGVAPFPAPYDGEFLQMDVVSVTAATP